MVPTVQRRLIKIIRYWRLRLQGIETTAQMHCSKIRWFFESVIISVSGICFSSGMSQSWRFLLSSLAVHWWCQQAWSYQENSVELFGIFIVDVEAQDKKEREWTKPNVIEVSELTVHETWSTHKIEKSRVFSWLVADSIMAPRYQHYVSNWHTAPNSRNGLHTRSSKHSERLSETQYSHRQRYTLDGSQTDSMLTQAPVLKQLRHISKSSSKVTTALLPALWKGTLERASEKASYTIIGWYVGPSVGSGGVSCRPENFQSPQTR